MGVKYILCCEGIGVRTLAAAQVLAELEADGLLSNDTKEKDGRAPFDLLVGVGQGAVLALALASTDVSCKQILQKMAAKANLTQVMDVSPWRRNTGLVTNEPVYSGDGKREFYKQLFPGNTLVHDISKPVVVLAYDLTARRLVSFASEMPDSKASKSTPGESVFNPPLADLADAVSATPVFYPPVSMQPAAEEGWFRGKNKAKTPHYFIDASIVSRSPVVAAVAHARQLWPESQLVVVTVGSGTSTRSIDPSKQKMGGIAWLQHDLISLTMEGDHALESQLSSMFEEDDVTIIRIDGPLSPSAAEDYDDTSPANVAGIIEAARSWYADKRLLLHQTLPGGQPDSIKAERPAPVSAKSDSDGAKTKEKEVPTVKDKVVEKEKEKDKPARTSSSSSSSKRSKGDKDEDDKTDDKARPAKARKDKPVVAKGKDGKDGKKDADDDEDDDDDDGKDDDDDESDDEGDAEKGSNCGIM